MVDAAAFYRALRDAGVSFFAGVPDSLLSALSAAIEANAPASQHLIAANEGGAVAAAAGHYLATGRPAVVYLQNSGEGNAINPLCSLVSQEVFGIPMLLLVGWRGEPGRDDEPQHRLQGRITRPLLELAGVPTEVLPADDDGAAACATRLLGEAREARRAVAAVIRRGTFAAAAARDPGERPLTRECAIETAVRRLPAGALVVCTTGMASRELYEIRERDGGDHSRDCLIVGSMGHASQVALGVALGRPERQVVCIDGDGAAIMHMGSLAVVGIAGAPNFKHLLLNNEAHDSVGGQPTAGARIDFPAIARACCYRWARRVVDHDDLARGIDELTAQGGPALLEVCVRRGTRADLGRPTTSPAAQADAFRRSFS